MPILGNFASNDPVVPLDSFKAFDAKMYSLGKDIDIKIYAGAKHGFSDPSGQSFDAVAAADVWQRAIGFLNMHLVHPSR
ncbi:MAG: hypothetical protein E2O52_02530 [Gammaproteobacteria bacterium]|nr:MAG: hypothetical protein E2O52_02530 [Gammaproteobacteria bacterium]